MQKQKKGMGRSTSAAGQLLGYSTQQTRLLCRLLECRTNSAVTSVSLEVIDDVAVHGKETVLEQTKSGLTQNPISDSSIHLWKTLSNWVNAIRNGVVGIDNTIFVLHVVQPYEGNIAQRINAVIDTQNAHFLISELKEKFWGPAPAYKKKASLSEETGKYINTVLTANPNLVAQLFVNFSLEKGTGDPIAEARQLITDRVVAGDSSIEPILERMLGWIKKRTDSLIAKGHPAIILREEFSAQLIACTRAVDRPTTALTSTAPEATQEKISNELHRTYIKQLQKIDLDESFQEEAASDYLRAVSDRTTWAEAGNIFEDDVIDFEKKLTRAWKSHRSITNTERIGLTRFPELPPVPTLSVLN